MVARDLDRSRRLVMSNGVKLINKSQKREIIVARRKEKKEVFALVKATESRQRKKTFGGLMFIDLRMLNHRE